MEAISFACALHVHGHGTASKCDHDSVCSNQWNCDRLSRREHWTEFYGRRGRRVERQRHNDYRLSRICWWWKLQRHRLQLHADHHQQQGHDGDAVLRLCY